jgi:hypothetical protein
MKLGMIAACVAALATAGVAAAQDLTINEYVVQMVAERADAGETLVGDIVFDEIEEGESASHTFRINPRKSYFVYAACDDDCGDIDLFGENDDGDVVDVDEEDDDIPLLLVLPGESGRSLTVTLDMAACDTDVCVYAIGLYEVED